MPKGHQRSNREAKKPKQPKKPAGAVAPHNATSPIRVPAVPGKKT